MSEVDRAYSRYEIVAEPLQARARLAYGNVKDDDTELSYADLDFPPDTEIPYCSCGRHCSSTSEPVCRVPPIRYSPSVLPRTVSLLGKVGIVGSVREVADAARAAVAALPVQVLDEVEHLLDESATMWQHCTEGSYDPVVDEGHDAHHYARDRLDNVRRLMALIPTAVEQWITGLGVGATPGPVDRDRADVHGRGEVPKRERDRLLEACRQRLAPGIPRAATHGWWVDAEGAAHQLKSGRDGPWADAAREFTRSREMVRGAAALGLTRHVEVQFAMRMRARGLTNESIVIDRLPCGVKEPAEWTCHEKLVEFLPPGARLTVITHSGRRFTYSGAAE